MIKVRNLQYKYRRACSPVLQDISFDVKNGEVVALMGKNGSGKSTIGRLVSGIVRPQKNQVFIDGIDVGIKKNYKKIFSKVGIVFQNPETQIIFNNVRDELKFALGRHANAEKIMDEVLEQVGMTGRADDLWDFSLGQKQRIVIAEILARRTRYLILDEPTAMIDSVSKHEIWKIIHNLQSQGIGILLITNSDEEASIADRIITLQNGYIK